MTIDFADTGVGQQRAGIRPRLVIGRGNAHDCVPFLEFVGGA